ncbi:MAG: dTDP-4-amino-4,6-dideoxygalactose transaminase [Vicinamibacteraceae bacterium]
MSDIRVPFNRPTVVGDERRHIETALASGHWSGDGEFTTACQRLLETSLGVAKALLTTSCTHALELAALLLDIEAGDEVIVPSFTFVSTANAFALRGARIVFADIRTDTLNLDERQLDALAGPRTKAIVAVHYAGVACEMDAIVDFASARGISVIEDNAHGLSGRYRDRPLGTIGRAATLSFHETKNVTCGEGGALLLNDTSWIARAEILREKGTNRSQFLRETVSRYQWMELGSSYVPSDLLSAVLLAQLERIEWVQDCRRRLWTTYRERLSEWAGRYDVALPVVPETCTSAHHLFHLVMPDDTSRDGLLAHLRLRGILAVFHYVPLHSSPMGQRFGARDGDCPVAEVTSRRLLRLPFYTSMTVDDQDLVIDAVTSFVPAPMDRPR